VKIAEDQIPKLMREGKDREVVPLLYRKVFPLVQKYITKRSGRKDDADDVFQDAMMIFYKQVIKDSFDSKYNVYGYLYRLSINCWINKVKKESRIELMDEMIESGSEEILEVRESMVSDKDDNLLKSVFSDIGDKCIELLTYTIYYSLLMEDIMIRMGFTSVSAVKMQQQRCKQKLIKEIEKNPDLAERLKGI
jgi:RNA polymerase sigma factor (sigma-70 family)